MPKRKTDEQFKKEVSDLVGDEYIFLDQYTNNHTKLRVKHSKCGSIYKVKPNNFLNGSRCPYCSDSFYFTKTNSQFKREIKNLVGDEYTFLDSYQGTHTKLRVKHNKCGQIYKARPNNFLSGQRCPYCRAKTSGKVKIKTNEEFKKEAYDLVGNEYAFLDSYVNNHTRLRVKHNKCGNTYKVTPNGFLRGSRCPYCFGTPKKTDGWFRKEVYDLVGCDYTFLEPYVNTNTKIKVKHNKCGSIYKVKPVKFLRGSRCPYCFGNIKKTNAQFKQEVFNLVGNEYTFLDAYANAYTKIRVKHNKCNAIYEVRPTDFLSHNSRCPYCNIPHGEDLINKILKSLSISYEYQKTFVDLEDTQPLSYDFFIPSQNILIEYQGIQHYKPVCHFGGEDQFKLQQKHDKMKADYAKANNYNLIAIPYTEDTFSKIKKYLIKHGLKRH